MRRLTIFRFYLTLFCLPGCGALGQIFRPTDPAATHPIPPFSVPPAKPGVAYERFMAIGDMGTGTPDQHEVAAAMARKAKADGLDFILTVGDNFYPDGVASVDDPAWRTKFLDVYNDPALAVRVYASLGNHDHRGSVQAQIDFSTQNGRWFMPARYYTFTRTLSDGTRVQFFAIDSDPIENRRDEAAAQLAWLDSELGKSEARWKIVFGHHPLYSHGWHGTSRAMIDQLEPLFVKNGVDVYLAGHDHTLEMLKPVKGVHYVVTGAAGGPDKAYRVDWTDEAYYAATLGGFTYYRVSKDELVIEFVRLDGRTQYAHVLTQPGAAP